MSREQRRMAERHAAAKPSRLELALAKARAVAQAVVGAVTHAPEVLTQVAGDVVAGAAAVEQVKALAHDPVGAAAAIAAAGVTSKPKRKRKKAKRKAKKRSP